MTSCSINHEEGFMSRKLVTLLFGASLPLCAAAAPETYTFNPLETYPTFEVVNNVYFTNRSGRFDKTTGKFTMDRVAKTGSVEVIIQTASINTGDSERGARPRTRDEHLRSPDFFNAAEFPTITYRGSKVRFNGENPVAIDGELTMLGVTRPLTLNIDSFKCGIYPFGKKQPSCGGNASGTLRRSEFGMKYGIPNYSDEIKLTISFFGLKD
jgi:polyisoprenoid-binding protein YceI